MTRTRRWAARLAGAVVVAWVVAVAVVFVFQRRLVFPTPGALAPPASWEVVTSAAGLPVARWPGTPTVVYFHGQGSSLARLGFAQRPLTAQGLGLLLAEYPGYAGAPGETTEEGMYEAGRAAVALASTPPVCVGQSLGTGVAARLAAEGLCARLVLLAPYTSVPDVGAHRYPWLPVRLLARDRFDTLAIAPSITVPTLVIHGARDTSVPVAMGRAVAAAIPGAELDVRADRGHNDLWKDGIGRRIAEFARK